MRERRTAATEAELSDAFRGKALFSRLASASAHKLIATRPGFHQHHLEYAEGLLPKSASPNLSLGTENMPHLEQWSGSTQTHCTQLAFATKAPPHWLMAPLLIGRDQAPRFIAMIAHLNEMSDSAWKCRTLCKLLKGLRPPPSSSPS